jgi:pimeloyl-ACP methyl ester carboxylesterase
MRDGSFERLAKQYDVVRVDLRGFGETALPDEPFAIADDLARVIDDLGIAPTTIVGASMGGRGVVDLALHAPDKVGALVLVGTALSGMPMADPDMDPELVTLDEAFEAAVDRGDYDEAARIDVTTWVIGVGRAELTSNRPSASVPSGSPARSIR